MKEFNCPDCKIITESCQGCPRIKEIPTNTVKLEDYSLKYDFFPLNEEPCKSCLTNPRNGGSGFCNCTLPYLHSLKVT